MIEGNKEIKIGTHFSKKWLDKKSVTVKIDDILGISFENNLANVLMEKCISPDLSDSDLEKVNCTREKWQNLLEGKEAFTFMGSNENLYRIAQFLEVDLCDLWGLCGNGGNEPCGKCTIKHSWKPLGVKLDFK